MPVHASDLLPAERTALRDRLRAARYAALADAEGFHEVCYAVEALGMRLHGAESTIYGYWPSIRELAAHSPLFGSLPAQFPAFFTRFDALYETLRRARNDAMHSGSKGSESFDCAGHIRPRPCCSEESVRGNDDYGKD